MLAERYESLELIGEGGVGKVYRAFDRSLNRAVAIKQIKSGLSQQSGADGILAEARTLCRVQHPNIVTVYDVGRVHDDYFIVMELIEGENFEMLSKHGKMLYEQFLVFALQTQEGVIAAHHLGILHRDIKPANIMLVWLPSGSLHIKIVDFGLAQLAREAERSNSKSGKPNLVGSLHFMSPEQLEGHLLDTRSDLYSLGCLYYFALAQRYPFNGNDSLEIMISHIQHHVVPLQQIRPDLPIWLSEWVMWHIRRNPDERPSDAMTAFLLFKKQAGAACY